MKNKERIARLEHLYEVVKAVPAREFDQDTWGEKKPCGTFACTLGHASLDPVFRRKGLKGTWVHGYSEEVWDNKKKDYKDVPIQELDIRFENHTKFVAGTYFFGIEDGEADDLFQGGATKPQKLKQIKELIKEYKLLQRDAEEALADLKDEYAEYL